MATTENKVQFNLKNVHYAVMTASGATPTWETPVPVPGAVNLSLEAQGDLTPFYADGIVYYQSVGNNGYNGDLEMARFIDKMLQDVWGYILTQTDNTLIENAQAEAKAFARCSRLMEMLEMTFIVCTTAPARAPESTARPTRKPRNRRRRRAIFQRCRLKTGSVCTHNGADAGRCTHCVVYQSLYDNSRGTVKWKGL